MLREKYGVWLKSYPRERAEKFYRVLRKNNRNKLDPEVHALLNTVAGGKPVLVRAFEEEEAAEHLVKECAVNGGEAEIREVEGA
jgi:hypothetical protein